MKKLRAAAHSCNSARNRNLELGNISEMDYSSPLVPGSCVFGGEQTCSCLLKVARVELFESKVTSVLKSKEFIQFSKR